MSRKTKRFQSVFFELWQLLDDWKPEGQESVEVTLKGSSGRKITLEKNLQTWLESEKKPNTRSLVDKEVEG